MRKFNYFMAAFVFAAGVSASLTSCIDTEEPDGIKELRSAKAGYINAETAYKNAETAYKEAETANQLALNSLQLIKNRIKEVEAKTAELNYALREASQEDSIAIATTKAKTALENAKKELAVAISNNDYAVKQAAQKNAELIALLGVTPAVANQGIIYELKVASEALYGDGTTTKMGTIYTLAEKQKALAAAVAKNYQTSEDALKQTVEARKMILVAAQQAEQTVKDLFEDVDASTWYEQYQALEEDKMAQTYKDEQLKINKKTLEQEKSALEAQKKALETEYGKDLKDYNAAVSTPSFNATDEINNEIGGDLAGAWTALTYDDNGTAKKYNFEYSNGVYTLNHEIENEKLSALLADFMKVAENHNYSDKNFLESKRATVISEQTNIDNNKEYANETDYKDWQTALSDYNKNKNNTTLGELNSKSATLFGSTWSGVYQTTQFYAPSTSSDQQLIKDYTGSSKYVSWLKATVAKAEAEADFTKNYGAGATLYSAIKSLKSENDHVVDSLTEVKNTKLVGKDMTDLNDKIAAKQDEIDVVTAQQAIPSAQRGYDDAIITVIKTAFQQAGILNSADDNLGDYNATTGKFKAGTAAFDVTKDDFQMLKEKSFFNAKKDVTDAESEVKKAEDLLKLFQDGNYDATVVSQNAIKTAEEAVAAATRANELAQKRYDDALAAYKAAFQE